jgi:hypothetical protein
MPRVKQKSVRFVSNSNDANIHERLVGCANGDPGSIVEIGNLVENFLKSPMAVVLESLTVGRRSMEIEQSRQSQMSSDRFLGRIEMADLIWKDLEQFVHDKDMATKRIRVSRTQDESSSASMPEPDGQEIELGVN